MADSIKVPAIGEPEWQGKITEGKLTQVIGGLLIPNQAFAKAMARKLREYMRKDAEQGPNRIAILEGERDYFRNRYRAALMREDELLDLIVVERMEQDAKCLATKR
jgi:hypothetical protein